jgi:hypothetical protein
MASKTGREAAAVEADTDVVAADQVERAIFVVRGHKVLLDGQLAAFYAVSTKRLIEQVKRNISRFPGDFMFQLTADEWDNLRSQIATSSLRSRSVTSEPRTPHESIET